MNGKDIIKLLSKAGIIPPDATGVQLNAQIKGHLSIHTEYLVDVEEDDLARLREIEAIAGQMVKLQLEKGEVDDALAEQILELIRRG